MSPTELLEAVVVLATSVVAGTVAHELAHGTVLWRLGIPFDLEWLPDRSDSGVLWAGIHGRWAAVTPRTVPADLPPWRLRVAAIAPFALAIPFGLVPLGVVPDPFAVAGLAPKLAAVGWLACALPSPQDFSLFFHAEAALDAFAAADEEP